MGQKTTYLLTPCSMALHFCGMGLSVWHEYGPVASRLLCVEYVVPLVLKSLSRPPDSELIIGSFRPGIDMLACRLAPWANTRSIREE